VVRGGLEPPTFPLFSSTAAPGCNAMPLPSRSQHRVQSVAGGSRCGPGCGRQRTMPEQQRLSEWPMVNSIGDAYVEPQFALDDSEVGGLWSVWFSRPTGVADMWIHVDEALRGCQVERRRADRCGRVPETASCRHGAVGGRRRPAQGSFAWSPRWGARSQGGLPMPRSRSTDRFPGEVGSSCLAGSSRVRT
jgi:hypothetical protein